MIRDIIQHTVRFVLLVLVQVFVLNNIHVHGFLSPYIYPLFILLLPFDMPPALVMLLGLLLGLSIDKFSNSAGMHAAACVWLAFIRPFIFRWLTPMDGYKPEEKPRLYIMGTRWFIFYILIATLAHHLFLFIVETASFSAMGVVLMKTLINGLLSALMMFFLEALLGRRKAR